MKMDPLSLVEWHDEHVIVISKPPGLLSIMDGYDPQIPHLRTVLEPQFGRIWIVHRLDKETSGLMVLARNAESHRALNLQFDRAQVDKVYHAVIDGAPPWLDQEITLPLRKDGDRKHRTVVDLDRGKKAHTSVMVLERGKRRSLVEIRPRTGRTHQIRTHLAYLGFPITGDRLYGQSPMKDSTRMALHACQIGFEHPVEKEFRAYKIPDPTQFSDLLTG